MKMKKNKALFLDRDGVVNIDKNYVYKIEDIDFLDGIFEFCEHFQQRGFLIFIITNQAGIARGYYSVEDFRLLSEWMVSEFRERGITISKIYCCPHHPDITGPCECRKPNPGMILKAAREYNLDLSESVLIGNNESDIKAGENAGISRNYYFNVPSDFKKITIAEIENDVPD